jgi:hypothetical protein
MGRWARRSSATIGRLTSKRASEAVITPLLNGAGLGWPVLARSLGLRGVAFGEFRDAI